jgi:hypothetical protein
VTGTTYRSSWCSRVVPEEVAIHCSHREELLPQRGVVAIDGDLSTRSKRGRVALTPPTPTLPTIPLPPTPPPSLRQKRAKPSPSPSPSHTDSKAQRMKKPYSSGQCCTPSSAIQRARMRAIEVFQEMAEEVGTEVTEMCFRAAVWKEGKGFDHEEADCPNCWYRGVFCPCIHSRLHPSHPDHVCRMGSYCRCDL